MQHTFHNMSHSQCICNIAFIICMEYILHDILQYIMTVEEDVLQRVYMLWAGIVLATLALSYTTPWDNYLVYKV